MKHLHTFESFLNEGKIDTFTIMVGRHKNGHMVMSISRWDEEDDVQDYLNSPVRGDNYYIVAPKDLKSKITELKNEFRVKDKDITHNY